MGQILSLEALAKQEISRPISAFGQSREVADEIGGDDQKIVGKLVSGRGERRWPQTPFPSVGPQVIDGPVRVRERIPERDGGGRREQHLNKNGQSLRQAKRLRVLVTPVAFEDPAQDGSERVSGAQQPAVIGARRGEAAEIVSFGPRSRVAPVNPAAATALVPLVSLNIRTRGCRARTRIVPGSIEQPVTCGTW